MDYENKKSSPGDFKVDPEEVGIIVYADEKEKEDLNIDIGIFSATPPKDESGGIVYSSNVPPLPQRKPAPPPPSIPKLAVGGVPPEGIPDQVQAIAVCLSPDVCKTPRGSSTPPIPYQVWGTANNDAGYSPNVFYRGDAAMRFDSKFTRTYGDEPGTAKGIKSGTVGDIVEPTSHSDSVRINGVWAIRDLDTCTLNDGNCPGEFIFVKDTTNYRAPVAETETEEDKSWLEEAWDYAKKLDSEYQLSTRAGGALQIGGGFAEGALGSAMVAVGGASSSTGAGAIFGVPAVIVGGVLVVDGSDNIQAGLETLWNGKPADTLLVKSVAAAAEGLGASENEVEEARETARLTQASLGLFSLGAASFLASGVRVTAASKTTALAAEEVAAASRTPVTAGEPVVVTRGEYIETWVDFEIEATLPIRATRYYGHQMGAMGPLGRNAISAFDEIIVAPDDGTLSYMREDGRRIVFEPVPGLRVYQSASFVDYDLEFFSKDRLVLKQGFLERFFQAGLDGVYRLDCLKDSNGNQIGFIRDRAGRLTGLRHSDGFDLVFENDALGLRRSITRVVGAAPPVRLVTYDYDDRGNLITANCAFTYSLFYTYDARNRLESWHDGTKRSFCHFSYDDQDRVVHTRTSGPYHNDVFDYDPENRVTTYRPGGADASQRFWYDANQNVIREEDALGAVRTYEYDKAGFRVRETDGEGAVSTLVYGPKGEVRLHVDPEGRITRYGWGSKGELTDVVDPAGHRTDYVCDSRGNPVLVTDPLGGRTRLEWTKAGRLAGIVFADGSVQRRQYDSCHRLVAVTHPNGGTTLFRRDAYGRVLEERDPSGQTTRFVYGESRGKAFDEPTTVIRPDGARIDRSFDGEGQVSSVTDGEGRTTTYHYGAFDLLKSLEEPGGGLLSFSYNVAKQLVTVTNAEGRCWTFERDAAGRVVRETDFGGLRLTYAYDAAGRVVERGQPDGSRLTFAYDRSGLLLEETAHGPDSGTPPDVTRYAYDERGLLVEARNSAAQVVFRRDALGRVVEETLNGRTVKSAFDALGRRVSWEIGGCLTTVERDPLGLVRRLVIGEHAPLSFDRDVMGRETRRESEAGFRLEQSYDVLGQLIHQKAGLSIRSLGKGIEAAMNAQLRGINPQRDAAQVDRSYGWNKSFDPLWVTDARWGMLSSDYDDRGQIRRQSFGDGQAERFRYDATKTIIGFEDEASPPSTGGLWRSAPGGRSTKARGPNGEGVHLAYDDQGRVVERRVERNGFRSRTWRYGWDARNRLAFCVTSEGERWRYAYDPFGRRISRINETGWGEIIGTATLWDGDVVAEEAPIRADGAIDWDRATRWHYEPESFRPLAKETPDGGLSYIVTDHLGTPREMFTEKGRLVWAAEYRTWGAVRRLWRNPEADNDDAPGGGFGGVSGVGGLGGVGSYQPIPRTAAVAGNLALADTPEWQETAMLCPLRFQGQWEDGETGLYYNRFRYYDPLVGQYMSPDPIGLAGGINPHGYVPNPNAWVDPLGLAAKGGASGLSVPGRVQSRINLMQGSRQRGLGWDHLVHEHYNAGKAGKSQFTVPQDELRGVLQSREVVRSPITKIVESKKYGLRYLREVDLGRAVGIDKYTGQATSNITVMTDKFGNLITAYPGVP